MLLDTVASTTYSSPGGSLADRYGRPIKEDSVAESTDKAITIVGPFGHNPNPVEVSQLFGSQYPCTGGRKCRSRKNNDHWTEDEMVELVDGVSKKGIGKWSKVKGDYFSTSIRTAVHLKDKWRNLVRACKAKTTSKRKVNIQKATELIVRRFRRRILAIEAKRLGIKKRK
ncbi:hypothetical protein BAE44_0010446 [Dichanthelium oligosanthes]|uniref:Uncharacterized protein n=1 Tax=Dichanthelium oligosanthes TaxID=888268 RepID=A0A1E5VTU2_9POAL|nr:hypothetical protein BAE44_0010446 [Dichanthelium oligosanthes]